MYLPSLGSVEREQLLRDDFLRVIVWRTLKGVYLWQKKWGGGGGGHVFDEFHFEHTWERPVNNINC